MIGVNLVAQNYWQIFQSKQAFLSACITSLILLFEEYYLGRYTELPLPLLPTSPSSSYSPTPAPPHLLLLFSHFSVEELSNLYEIYESKR
jgi:hypothetical protein